MQSIITCFQECMTLNAETLNMTYQQLISATIGSTISVVVVGALAALFVAKMPLDKSLREARKAR